MGKPYSDLEKRALAILANGGDPAKSQDTALAKYWAWKINPSSNAHNLPAESTRTAGRKKTEVALLPFGVTLGANVFAKAQITKRTDDNNSSIQSECGYQTLSIEDQALRLRGYNPAYVYWRTGAATTSTQRTSRITGKPYKSYYAQTDQGYLAPFGRKAAGDTEGERQKAIKGALGTSINLITFTPEKYRG